MSALPALRSIARGERPNGEVLPPCRLEAFGSVCYGEEAIVQSFRQAPLELSEDAAAVEIPGHLAIFDGDTALIADLSGDAIARLWRLGIGDPGETERALDVPFDADLTQSRADLAIRAEDHPALPPEAVPLVEDLGRSLSRGWSAQEGPSPYRARSFLVRAFAQGSRGVALFAVYRLGPASVRTAGFSYAAVLFEMQAGKLGSHQVIRDLAGEAAIDARPWRPRFE